MRLPQARLDQVLDRFHEVEARMGSAADGAEIVRLSKEHAELKPVADAVQGLARARAEMDDLKAMTADPEIAAMAEDELAALTELLSEAGHSVVGPFHNAAAAEAAAALHSIDAALLDINLSGEMTGVELARMLTARWDVPVVFVSGDVAAAARHADMAEALVLKPYNGAQILEAVARIGQAA